MKVTLLTNISFIQHDDLRLSCNAVLIEDDAQVAGAEQGLRIRGFGPDGDWEVFTLWMPPATTWEIADLAATTNSAVMPAAGTKVTPLFCGSVLMFSTGQTFCIQPDDHLRPLDIMDATHIGFPGVWEKLQRKAVEYWHAPKMPILRWEPANELRCLFKHFYK